MSTDSLCAGVHEPIEKMQDAVLKILNMMGKVLVDRVKEVRIEVDSEIVTVAEGIVSTKNIFIFISVIIFHLDRAERRIETIFGKCFVLI